MAIEVSTYVWKHSQQRGTKLLLELAIADSSNSEGACWPSYRKLAAYARVSPSRVKDIMRELRRIGVIAIRGRSGKSNMIYHNGFRRQAGLDPVADQWIKPRKGPGGENAPSPEDRGVKIPSGEGGENAPQGGGENAPMNRKEPSKEPSSAGAGETGASKNKKTTVPKSRMTPMKDAITAAFKWDQESMTKQEWGKVQRAAKELCEADVQPDLVKALYAECQSKYSQFSPVALAGVVSTVRQRREAQRARQQYTTAPEQVETLSDEEAERLKAQGNPLKKGKQNDQSE